MIFTRRTGNMQRHIIGLKSVGAIPCALALGASFIMLTSCADKAQSSESTSEAAASQSISGAVDQTAAGQSVTASGADTSVSTAQTTSANEKSSTKKTTRKTVSKQEQQTDSEEVITREVSATTTLSEIATSSLSLEPITKPAQTSQSGSDEYRTTTSRKTTATTRRSEIPANATVTTKKTARETTAASSKVTAASTPDVSDSGEYQLFEDGYITKYDEKKIKNLTSEQREAFDTLAYGIWEMEPEINIPYGVIERSEAADLLYAVLECMPEVNYVSGTYRISVSSGYVKKYSIDYTLSRKDAAKQHSELRKAAAKILGQLDSSMSDSEKIKFLHDYIIRNCEYSSDDTSCFSAYGCLVKGKAVCEGYAMALDYLCEKAGIYSLLESGTALNSQNEEISHIWNKILIDGKWYNFDFTWDDPVSSFGSDYIKYDYYALTDDEISKNHILIKNKFLYYPSATATDENYFISNGFYITSQDEVEETFIRSLEKSLSEGIVGASVKCADSELADYVNDLVLSSDEDTGEKLVSQWLTESSRRAGVLQSYKGFYMVRNETLDTVMIVLKQ